MEEDIRLYLFYFKTSTGKDESHALEDRSEAKGVSKHECHAHHF